VAVVLHQVDLIAFLEAKFPDKLGGQTDGKRVAPFCDLHWDAPLGYTSVEVYPKWVDSNVFLGCPDDGPMTGGHDASPSRTTHPNKEEGIKTSII
jgi:hypothetical protein